MATRRTPETLTAVERAAALARQGTPLPTLSLAPTKPGGTPPMTRTEVKNAAVAEQVRMGLGQIARPQRPLPPTPPTSLDPREDPDDSFSLLPISEVEVYEHNPRTGKNPRYDDIRASIIADGITNPITVTRPHHKAKYHPYGGGNTRLSIAKELNEAGDTRFSHIKVLFKAWPGHANVISAHLAENENRGEITFWERAQGVADFKEQFEAEHRVVLSTGELARELKSHGINFGVKVVQNFAFAVENLKPIGQWLKATEVNEVIRPGMAGAMAVATYFGIRSFTEVFEPVLLKHRDQLLAAMSASTGSGGKDAIEVETESKPVELDAAELVSDLHQALATAVGVSPEVVPLMISAVESNSRITADELRAIQIRKPETSGAGTTPQAPAPAPSQRSLTGMLAGVPSPPPTSAPPASPAPAPSSAARMPAEPPAPAGAPPLTPAFTGTQQRNPQLAGRVADGDPTVHVLSLILDISDMVHLSDCLLHVPDMPFGYVMDIPVSLENIGDKTIPYPQLRASAWKFLASLSGQVDPAWFTHVDQSKSRWTQTALQGPDVFRQTYAKSLRGITAEDGNPAMLLTEVYLMFNQPELGYLTVQLLRAMEQLRLDHPERFVRTVTPDPDYPA